MCLHRRGDIGGPLAQSGLVFGANRAEADEHGILCFDGFPDRVGVQHVALCSRHGFIGVAPLDRAAKDGYVVTCFEEQLPSLLSGLAGGSEDDDSQVSLYLSKDADDKEVSRTASCLPLHALLPYGSITLPGIGTWGGTENADSVVASERILQSCAGM